MGDLEALEALSEWMKAQPDPFRDGLKHGESTPGSCASVELGEMLQLMRRRFRLNRVEMALRAGLSARVVSRIEKGADMRLSTLKKLFAAVGCRPVILPADVLDDLDWHEAHEEDRSFESRRYIEKLEKMTPEEMDAECERLEAGDEEAPAVAAPETVAAPE